ncbi:MAG: hypothetical protein AAF688_00135 [Bacteroidota bacterium]
MKKDIDFPKVEEVYVVAVREIHPEYNTDDWNAYIINNRDEDLDTVLISSRGYSEEKVTPVMRHQIKMLPARSFAKIEFLQEDLLGLNNEFKVTFFLNGEMFDKTYLFKKDTIKESTLRKVPLMRMKGIKAK